MSAVAEASLRPRALAALQAIRPHLTIISDVEGLKPFETDALIAHRETPMLAVLPETEGQVRDVGEGVPQARRAGGVARSGHRASRRRDPAPRRRAPRALRR
jgi:glycolate oxidase